VSHVSDGAKDEDEQVRVQSVQHQTSNHPLSRKSANHALSLTTGVLRVSAASQSIRKIYATSFQAKDVRDVVMQLNESHSAELTAQLDAESTAHSDSVSVARANDPTFAVDDEGEAGENAEQGEGEDQIEALYRVERRRPVQRAPSANTKWKDFVVCAFCFGCEARHSFVVCACL
jgi:hypothetical protein